MPRIEDQSRRVWQLSEQGHSIEEIANALACSTTTVERWLLIRDEISHQEKPWFAGLDGATVSALRYAGIRSRPNLVNAWESGDIEHGRIQGIGSRRQLEIRQWLMDTCEHGEAYPPKAILVELPLDAESALLTLENRLGHSKSQIISQLLLSAMEVPKGS